jgi:hypothetical protein
MGVSQMWKDGSLWIWKTKSWRDDPPYARQQGAYCDADHLFFSLPSQCMLCRVFGLIRSFMPIGYYTGDCIRQYDPLRERLRHAIPVCKFVWGTYVGVYAQAIYPPPHTFPG